ncbi:hypothetical protein [Morganella morganii]|uniref:hypothetical protein n=1 Tax=Morganella morganii TaxID=582 RepID=UPI0023687F51|nr:hypothetical protein [Morganella morganii]
MNKLLLALLLTVPLISNAAWFTKVEDSIFDEKNALLIGEIYGNRSFMVFECKGSDLYFSYVEPGHNSDNKSYPVNLLFKVDNNAPIEFKASFESRNSDYMEAITKDKEKILIVLNQLKSAKTKYMSGLSAKNTDFRVSFSGNVYRSTAGVNSFMNSCGISNDVQYVKSSHGVGYCNDSLKKNNNGKLLRVITNQSLMKEAICYNGKDVTQKIANSMGISGEVDKNLRVGSWSDNKNNRLYVSFYNKDTGDVSLDIAYLDKGNEIKTTKNHLILKNEMPERLPETNFQFVGEVDNEDNRWLYFNAVEATNLYSYRIKLKENISPDKKAEVEFFSNGGVYKIWRNGYLSVETSWIDDSKGRVLGGVIKDHSGKQICELVTNDQEIPVDQQKCK